MNNDKMNKDQQIRAWSLLILTNLKDLKGKPLYEIVNMVEFNQIKNFKINSPV